MHAWAAAPKPLGSMQALHPDFWTGGLELLLETDDSHPAKSGQDDLWLVVRYGRR